MLNCFYKLKNNNDKYNIFFIKIKGSKSLSNRLLILKKIYKNINLINLSDSDDTFLLKNLLINNKKFIYVKNAGTVLRFLISYLYLKNKKKIFLYGINRINKRPIKYLINFLLYLGLNIQYLKNKYYTPILINKSKYIKIYNLNINIKISSQYLSSILLIINKINLINTLFFNKKIISFFYIKMTYLLLKILKNTIYYNNNKLFFNKLINSKINYRSVFYLIESDWSSLNFYYSIILFIKKIKLKLKYFFKNSLQGDNIIYKLYNKYFNIKTKFVNKKIYIYKNYNKYKKYINNIFINFINYPDLVPTFVLIFSLLKKNILFYGLKTLNLKETNRLKALKNELQKINIILSITMNSLNIKKYILNRLNKKINLNIYNDHRLIMAFLLLIFFYKKIYINNYKCINKSYSLFWKQIQYLGFNLTK
ncbi:MAG: 3-phosphoshikimate 1-carboxyvinyltransferase [Candidatus Shikimatogenerans sp. AspAUS03]|uniref:3-phosphoshikimate 1-carboxyvinyltransferase n=1 Tax=Candidatus Shikimatogenerans sp. AspAUS03 TaxID=3158563 RepID=A0AAU7QT13_9FLAO